MRKKTLFQHGDQSPNPWDLPHFRQNAQQGRQAAPPFRHRARRSGSIPGVPCPPPQHRQYNPAADKIG